MKTDWIVVKFITAATGFRRSDARKMLADMSTEFQSHVFMAARAWDREAAGKAAELLSSIMRDKPPQMILDATKQAATRQTTTKPALATAAHKRR